MGLSVVVSTKQRDEEYVRHLKSTSGLKDIEIIIYENPGKYSLTELYNKGLKEAKNNNIVFCHDDLIIETRGWAKKLLKVKYNNPDYGILGIAGTTELPENGMWWTNWAKMMGSVWHTHEGRTWQSKYSGVFKNEILDAILVDGLFFLVDRDLIKKKFDDYFKGFHFYEIDFCVSNWLEGVKIGVNFEVKVIHKSVGMVNDEWHKNRFLFVGKHFTSLPLKQQGELKFNTIKSIKNNKVKVGVVVNSAFEEDDIKKHIEDNCTYNNIVWLDRPEDEECDLYVFFNETAPLNDIITEFVKIYTRTNNCGIITARTHLEDNSIVANGIDLIAKDGQLVINKNSLGSFYNFGGGYKTNTVGSQGYVMGLSKRALKTIRDIGTDITNPASGFLIGLNLIKSGYVNVHSEESCSRLLDEYEELRDNPDLGHVNQLLGTYDYKRFIKNIQNEQQK
tara:strand:+ start:3671 stop:5017 length:1347 start_codon:yes stop_codon:yes gene_type:complete